MATFSECALPACAGERGVRNVYLQAISLGFGTVVVGAFDDDEVERLLHMPDDGQALCIMPVGRG